jgi:hypothetical protein
LKLWTDPNSAPDPIFDEWKLIEKRGKRTADTSNIGEPKRSDQRVTPTKMKARTRPAEPEKSRSEVATFKVRPTRAREILQPHAIKKKLIFMNPYENPKKQVDHPVVWANRPQTWQQRLKVPPNWGDDDDDNNETMEFRYTSPAPPSPQSPQQQFPAAETQLGI